MLALSAAAGRAAAARAACGPSSASASASALAATCPRPTRDVAGRTAPNAPLPGWGRHQPRPVPPARLLHGQVRAEKAKGGTPLSDSAAAVAARNAGRGGAGRAGGDGKAARAATDADAAEGEEGEEEGEEEEGGDDEQDGDYDSEFEDEFDEEEFDSDDEDGDGGADAASLAEGLDDAGAVIDLGGAAWGPAAVAEAQAVLDSPELAGLTLQIYSLHVLPRYNNIVVKLDKLDDRYGSPSLDEISTYTRLLCARLEAAAAAAAEAPPGAAPGAAASPPAAAAAATCIPPDVGTEVSTPGAERPLRLPWELARFQGLPLRVAYTLEGQPEKVEILELLSLDEGRAEGAWKLAEVRANRPPGKGRAMTKKQKDYRLTLPHAAIRSARIHIDF